ncbi:DUF5348 domain-containing protein [Bacillus sp. FSL W8-1127]|uniref:DUF5348 domain-containing protein n=1 Tax=Bacillus sp. FSL W8-1127 TaxID=2954710 RepID=UPI0030FB6F1F
MSKELRGLLQASEDLRHNLKKFLDKYEAAAENISLSSLSLEERSDCVTLYQVQDILFDAYILLKNLDKPVKAEGYLDKQKNGRYAIGDVELTSGMYVEYFSDEDGGYYVPSRLEHNGDDYYIVELGKDRSIEGLKVRIK